MVPAQHALRPLRPLRFSCKRNEDEDVREKCFTLCQLVPVESFKGLQTEISVPNPDLRQYPGHGRCGVLQDLRHLPPSQVPLFDNPACSIVDMQFTALSHWCSSGAQVVFC